MKTEEQIRKRLNDVKTFYGEISEEELDDPELYYDEGQQTEIAVLAWVLDDESS
jgi:hypothetical protein